MYFPYLRGKQFELIALKEISPFLSKKRTKVSPIIEPVKSSTTLKTTILALKQSNVNFNIIINPSVGDLQKSSADIFSILQNDLNDYKNFQIAIILSGKENQKSILSLLKKNKDLSSGLSLIHDTVYDNIEDRISMYNDEISVKYNIVNFSKTNRRYYRQFKGSSIIELDDFFNLQQRNVDYKPIDESDFSDEHLYFKEEGFSGFSDFLTIGDNYSESGFLPYAVAIHLSYSDLSKKIKIKHFVSDSNDDNSDIAGKFSEALDSLVTWCDKTNHKTNAVEIFRELHKRGHFPGLGTVKKLSIMNHIEVVLNAI